MAFNVYFNTVVNDPVLQSKANPWRCDKCHEKELVLIRGKIDYDTIILCKKCIKDILNSIEDKEREYDGDKGDI